MAARSGVGRAALALLALALLACAPQLAQAQTCEAGTAASLTFDLLSATGGSCTSTPLALCLSSFRIDVAATSCAVTVTPLLASNTYVAGIWSSSGSTGTYTRLMACPTWAREPVALLSGSTLEEKLQATIELAIEQHIYGSGYPQTLSSNWNVAGQVTLTTTAGSCALKYAITQATSATQISVNAVQTGCTDGQLTGTECNGSQTGCAAGTRPVSIANSAYACALCPAGTYSLSGSTSCTACAKGKAAGAVGQTTSESCEACAAGSYASVTGQSQCLPCPIGTYQDGTAKATCIPCPASSYARWPGSSQCVKCIAGVPNACTISSCNSIAASPGYHVLSISTPDTLKTCLDTAPTYAKPLLFQQCTVTSGSGTTYLSVYVDQYCGVKISPITDSACSEPGATGYSYSSITIWGHYVKTDLIATRLDTTPSNLTSSYLLTIAPNTVTTGVADDVTVSYWPVTTDVSKAAGITSTPVCSGTATVVGNQVVGVPTSAVACPAGSYVDTNVAAGCLPCPAGKFCISSTQATPCDAGEFQPLLGQTTDTCQACSSGYTSYAGADYCTIPYVDTTCSNGQEYDPEKETCAQCPAGMKRSVSTEDSCVPCEPGYYSAAGAASCTPCPVNQFSPVYGLAERSTGDLKCIYCPTGSVAVAGDNDAVGQLGSTSCLPCKPGTYSTRVGGNTYNTCADCAEGYFRSGFASSTNNVCRMIPSGYKEKNRTDTEFDRAEIVPCGKGEVSFWTGTGPYTRTPANSAQTCQACTANTYAPRTGMAACLPCRAGTYPTKSSEALPGNDQCSLCTGNTYRSASSTSSTCLVCTAGREVQPSSRSLCEPCDAGHFMPDNSATPGTDLSKPANASSCWACPVNTYQPRTGAASCINCPAGSSTQDVGNAECTACPLGYYSPSAASVCLEAPRGTYVNRTGATYFTPCPKGTYSNVVAADECEPCAPGQYSNAQGSTQCRPCPAGTASAGMAATCFSCQPGYSSSAGSGACSPCKPGTYASVARSAACSRCPKGHQCPTPAIRTPQPCPRGYYSNTEGARLCLPCPVNTFQSATGQRQCTMCASGYSTRGLTGQSRCQPLRTTTVTRRLLQ